MLDLGPKSASIDPDGNGATVLELSLTMSKHKGHVPPVWARLLLAWMKKRDGCLAGAVSLERGGKQAFLHCQCILRMRIDPSQLEMLKAELKELMGWKRGDGSGMYCQLKEDGSERRWRSGACEILPLNPNLRDLAY